MRQKRWAYGRAGVLYAKKSCKQGNAFQKSKEFLNLDLKQLNYNHTEQYAQKILSREHQEALGRQEGRARAAHPGLGLPSGANSLSDRAGALQPACQKDLLLSWRSL